MMTSDGQASGATNLGGSGRTIAYCRTCLMPNTRPRIVFTDSGQCNACVNADEKKERIDWPARRAEFDQMVDPFRSRDGSWDCIVPWSGGKDST